PRKGCGKLLHSPCVARCLPGSWPATYRQPWIQSRSWSGAGAHLPAAPGVLEHDHSRGADPQAWGALWTDVGSGKQGTGLFLRVALRESCGRFGVDGDFLAHARANLIDNYSQHKDQVNRERPEEKHHGGSEPSSRTVVVSLSGTKLLGF